MLSMDKRVREILKAMRDGITTRNCERKNFCGPAWLGDTGFYLLKTGNRVQLVQAIHHYANNSANAPVIKKHGYSGNIVLKTFGSPDAGTYAGIMEHLDKMDIS